MSTRNLDQLFKPASVALIGASDRQKSVGAVILRNLRAGSFGGELLLVNPQHDVIEGMHVFPNVTNLPAAPDLAVVATPPDQVTGVISDLGRRGTKAAIVITAGFAELGDRGAALQKEMLAAAQPHTLRIVGPNCVGVAVSAIGLNATFAQVAPLRGDIALLSQSGAMVTAMLDWAGPRGIGFSHVVSVGDMADVDFGDLIEYLNADPAVRAIVLYIEGLTHAQKFMAAARAVARSKPVLVLKVGRHAEGAKAARSHTGALAGSDVVYDAAFRRAGLLRVDTMPEIFDGLQTLGLTVSRDGDRLGILTNGGGPGVIATDALIASGGRLASLSPSTMERLDDVLPPTWSHGNPVDMVGDAPPKHYSDVLDALLADDGIDAVLVLHCPTALADPTDAARAVIQTTQAARNRAEPKNVFTAWLGDYSVAAARRIFAEARVATYETPEDAVQGFMHRVRYHHNQALLAEEPAMSADGPSPDAAAVRAIVERAASSGVRWLDMDDVEAILRAYGIPTLAVRKVADAEGAANAAAEIGGPVALKIASRAVTHKSDVGGVALNLIGPDAVRREAAAMVARVKRARADADIEGFIVQAMAVRPESTELIVGLSVDPVFGPIVLFGHGGTAVELIADSSLELPPLNPALAKEQMARTRIWRALQGYRSVPPADIEAIAGVLVRIGRLGIDHPAISELDINPLLADARGVIAVDARIAVTQAPAVTAALIPPAVALNRSC